MRFYRPRMTARDRFLTFKALNYSDATMLRCTHTLILIHECIRSHSFDYFNRLWVFKVYLCLCFSLQDFYKFYEVIGLKWKVRFHTPSHDDYTPSVYVKPSWARTSGVCVFVAGSTEWGVLVWWSSSHSIPHFQRFLRLPCHFKFFLFVTVFYTLMICSEWPGTFMISWHQIFFFHNTFYDHSYFFFLTGMNLLVKSKAFQYAMCKLYFLNTSTPLDINMQYLIRIYIPLNPLASELIEKFVF